MAATILAAGTGAGTSSNVTVTAGSPITVGLFTAASGAIPYFDNPIECDLQDPGGNWVLQSPFLDSTCPSIVLIGPGVYRFRRLSAVTVSIGIMTG